MKITDIRVRLINAVEGDSKLKAYVDVTFDNCFVVHGLKVIERQSGLFIAMPSKRVGSGEFKDIVHPILPEFRTEITEVILSKYEEEKNK